MHLEFLVEDFSTQVCLDKILPKMFPREIDYSIHSFRGKSDLLENLPARLKGYKSWITNDSKIIIVIDQDNESCRDLKNKLETMVKEAGFITKSKAQPNQSYQVLTRIAIEELEAWFFGDVNAIVSAYPRVSSTLGEQRKYRDPDAIKGGTWEALERELKKAGYHNHKGRLEKIKAAREISQYMNPQKNRSKSFQVFYKGLLEMIKNET